MRSVLGVLLRFNSLILAVVLMSVTFQSQADVASKSSKVQSHAVKGAGLGTCTQFLKSRKAKSRDYFLYAGWLDGYLSGFNQYHKQTYDIAPWQTTELLLGLLASHCNKVPDDPYFTAVNRMLPVLFKYRLIEKGEVLQISKGSKGQIIHKDVIKLAQIALKQKGFYHGKADGNYTNDVSSALALFQKKTKIAQTGMPDANTLYALLMAP